MVYKTIAAAICAAVLSLPSADGFSTDASSVARSFGTNSATTNTPILVTVSFSNGTGSSMRGFIYSEQIPSGLKVATVRLSINGLSVTNYTVETGASGDVYSGCTPVRWVLERPTGFTENNPVPASGTVQVQYTVTSATVGTFNLQQFGWAGFNPVSTSASFGYSESADARSVSFVAGTPPAYPVLKVSPLTLNFSSSSGVNPANQPLGITNTGAGTLSWSAVADGSAPAWLSVSPTTGTGNGNANVAVASASLPAGTYSKTITVVASGATNSPQTVTVNLTVNPPVPTGTVHYDFTYASRASLVADGWDFLARTAGGATRNTEQTSGTVVDYNQSTHPGILRIPADVGDLWASANDTRNTIFRDVPTNWTRLSVKMSFAPTQNYQQAGIVAYQDDDNYVHVDRVFNSSSKITLSQEVGGSAAVINSVSATATSNFCLRLDRDLASGTISAAYSLDGMSWVILGSVTQTLKSPRLGIFVGASPGGFPNADINWAEVSGTQSNSPPPTAPVLTVSPGSLSFMATSGGSPASQALGIANTGGGTLTWTAVADSSAPSWLSVSPTNGTGNGAVSVSVASTSLAAGTYNKTITVNAAGATNSPQTISVSLTINPAAPSGTAHYDFTYTNRASLLAGGWDFLARTASGASRNTEQTSGKVVDYNQAVHPGALRIPADIGDLWTTANDTRNTVFRDVPTNWTSLRLKLAFAPTQNYQQAGMVVYQDDDNYVHLDRVFNSSNKMTFSREVGGSASVINSGSVTATTNLNLRLERAAGGNAITASYSLDGVNWVTLGSVTQVLSRPRLGIFVGASPGGYPNADINWAEVVTPQSGSMAIASPLAAAIPPASPPFGLAAPGMVNARFSFELATEPGVNYVVEYKGQLDEPSWTRLTNLLGSGARVRIEDPAAPSSNRWYRARATDSAAR